MKLLRSITAVSRDTTSNWNSHPDFVPMKGEVIVYTDQSTIKNEQGETVLVPGIKIGDGNAYLINLPFVGEGYGNKHDLEELKEMIEEHIADNGMHVSRQDREFWDNKLNLEVSGKKLIFNRN